MLAKRQWAEKHLDDLRGWLLLEPRGHADMYGGILTEPERTGSDVGVLFVHNAGFSTMCGHGIIALTTVLLELDLLPGAAQRGELAIDTPAGTVRARPRWRGSRVQSVAFDNVPSFAARLDATVAVPEVGTVRYDIAFGGAFYAFVEAADLGLACTPQHVPALIDAGRAIKRAIQADETAPMQHPLEPELGFLYGVIFTAPAPAAGLFGRHVCVFADGEVDRSPTGTGVSARAAVLHARGELELGCDLSIDSIVGSRFRVRAVRETTCGALPAVVPEVEGNAWLCGRTEHWLADDDPFPRGFLLR